MFLSSNNNVIEKDVKPSKQTQILRDEFGKFFTSLSIGHFVASGNLLSSCSPELNVESIGTIGIPISTNQISEIISKLDHLNIHQKPLQIESSNSKIGSIFLKMLSENLKSTMNTFFGGNTSLKLHKLLIFQNDNQKNDNLNEHNRAKSSFKLGGRLRNDFENFANLLVSMPSQYKGGLIKIRRGNTIEEANFSFQNRVCLSWVSALSNCEIEIDPLTEGTRLLIWFNVSFEVQNSYTTIPTQVHDSEMNRISKFQRFFDRFKNGDSSPYIRFLSHQGILTFPNFHHLSILQLKKQKQFQLEVFFGLVERKQGTKVKYFVEKWCNLECNPVKLPKARISRDWFVSDSELPERFALDVSGGQDWAIFVWPSETPQTLFEQWNSVWFVMYQEKLKESPVFDERDPKWLIIWKLMLESSRTPAFSDEMLAFAEFIDDCVEFERTEQPRKYSKELISIAHINLFSSKLENWCFKFGGLDSWIDCFSKNIRFVQTSFSRFDNYLLSMMRLSKGASQQTIQKVLDLTNNFISNMKEPTDETIDVLISLKNLDFVLLLLPHLFNVRLGFALNGRNRILSTKLTKLFDAFDWNQTLVNNAIECIDSFKLLPRQLQALDLVSSMIYADDRSRQIRIRVVKQILYFQRLIAHSVSNSNTKTVLLRSITHEMARNVLSPSELSSIIKIASDKSTLFPPNSNQQIKMNGNVGESVGIISKNLEPPQAISSCFASGYLKKYSLLVRSQPSTFISNGPLSIVIGSKKHNFFQRVCQVYYNKLKKPEGGFLNWRDVNTSALPVLLHLLAVCGDWKEYQEILNDFRIKFEGTLFASINESIGRALSVGFQVFGKSDESKFEILSRFLKNQLSEIDGPDCLALVVVLWRIVEANDDEKLKQICKQLANADKIEQAILKHFAVHFYPNSIDGIARTCDKLFSKLYDFPSLDVLIHRKEIFTHISKLFELYPRKLSYPPLLMRLFGVIERKKLFCTLFTFAWMLEPNPKPNPYRKFRSTNPEMLRIGKSLQNTALFDDLDLTRQPVNLFQESIDPFERASEEVKGKRWLFQFLIAYVFDGQSPRFDLSALTTQTWRLAVRWGGGPRRAASDEHFMKLLNESFDKFYDEWPMLRSVLEEKTKQTIEIPIVKTMISQNGVLVGCKITDSNGGLSMTIEKSKLLMEQFEMISELRKLPRTTSLPPIPRDGSIENMDWERGITRDDIETSCLNAEEDWSSPEIERKQIQ